MTVHIPSQTERLSVALEAAKVGNWTRLQEKVIESVAIETDQSDEWKLKNGALQTEILRSDLLRVVFEAAIIGQMKSLKVEEVHANLSRNGNDEAKKNNKSPVEPNSPKRLKMGARTYDMLESHVESTRKEKANSWTPEGTLERIETQEDVKEFWSDGRSSWHVPSPVVPRFRKRFSIMTKTKLRECVNEAIVLEANDRAWRLEHDSRGLQVTDTCSCVYCMNPTPYQTQEYQRLRERLEWEINNPDQPLPTQLVPKFSRPKMNRAASEKDIMDDTVRKAAEVAWDRHLSLQKKGRAHRVTLKCRCLYCSCPSASQTKKYKDLASTPHTLKLLHVGVPPPPIDESPSLARKALLSPLQINKKASKIGPSFIPNSIRRRNAAARRFPPTFERSMSASAFTSTPCTERKRLSPAMLSKTPSKPLKEDPATTSQSQACTCATPQLTQAERVVENREQFSNINSLPPWVTPIRSSRKSLGKTTTSRSSSPCSITAFESTPKLDDDVDEEEIFLRELLAPPLEL